MSSVELDYKLTPMALQDLSSVLNNERQSYEFPWTEGIFRDCLQSGNECWLFKLDTLVIGHGILSVAAGECHLLNVCISPHYRGYGFGKVLVEHMLMTGRNRGANCAFLEVRPSNVVAHQLYESLGFNEIGLRPGYYPAASGREDALVLAKEFL